MLGILLAGLGHEVRGQEADLSFLRTRAELSDYEETTGYDEAIGFLEVAAAQSADLTLTHFGYSVEGRRLPLVVWGAPADPEAILADDRLRVFVQANIHAGEVCGKDAMLAMIRDLAAGRYDAWRSEVILLIAPIYNVDGNERVNLYNRPRQNGPVGGMGQRPNAENLDLNRDHMKLASPEARSLVGLMKSYDPHVLIDLHTTNGTRHGYHLTYSPPLNPNTAPAIDSLLRDRLLPDVTESVKERYGWDYYYYGNLPFRGGEPGWYTFDHRPRFNNNYVGLRNRVAILSEAYAYASYRD
ncbi:MAG: M14 family metallopeptidase, partial [Rhodothermales bacterium]|nr:M14 family metallopeptidase [Rhodothermales bacterium]